MRLRLFVYVYFSKIKSYPNRNKIGEEAYNHYLPRATGAICLYLYFSIKGDYRIRNNFKISFRSLVTALLPRPRVQSGISSLAGTF